MGIVIKIEGKGGLRDKYTPSQRPRRRQQERLGAGLGEARAVQHELTASPGSECRLWVGLGTRFSRYRVGSGANWRRHWCRLELRQISVCELFSNVVERDISGNIYFF